MKWIGHSAIAVLALRKAGADCDESGFVLTGPPLIDFMKAESDPDTYDYIEVDEETLYFVNGSGHSLAALLSTYVSDVRILLGMPILPRTVE